MTVSWRSKEPTAMASGANARRKADRTRRSLRTLAPAGGPRCAYGASGQGRPQAMARPSGQTIGGPAAHSSMAQFCEPAVPSGQRTRQRAPSWQTAWHGPLSQVKSQSEPGPQVQVPLAQVPVQRDPAPHVT